MRLRFWLTIAGLGLCLVGAAFGQTLPAAAPPAFAVASVRPAAPHSPFHNLQLFGDRLSGTVNRDALVGFAFNLGPEQIRGLGPEPDFFVVAAEAGPHATAAQVRAMAQTLLARRFGLVSHFAFMPAKAYALVVATTGLRIKPAQPARSSAAIPSGAITEHYKKGYFLSGRGVLIGQLCSFLQSPLGAVVIDKTGLSARYDFDLHFQAPNRRASATGALPSIFNALERQLGLKLVPVTTPVKILVVDHMNSTPTPN